MPQLLPPHKIQVLWGGLVRPILARGGSLTRLYVAKTTLSKNSKTDY